MAQFVHQYLVDMEQYAMARVKPIEPDSFNNTFWGLFVVQCRARATGAHQESFLWTRSRSTHRNKQTRTHYETPRGLPPSRGLLLIVIYRLSLRPFCCRRLLMLSFDVFWIFCLGFLILSFSPAPVLQLLLELWFGACSPSSSILS